MFRLTDRRNATLGAVLTAGLLLGAFAMPAMAAPQDADTIDDVQEERLEQLQRTRAEFDNGMQTARQFLSEADYNRARQEAVLAQVRLDQRRLLLPESEYTRMYNEAESLIALIDEQQEVYELDAARESELEARASQEIEERQAAQERQRLIEENLKRIRQLQAEMKYAEAIQVCDEILFIDPLNETAFLLRRALEANQLYQDYAEIQRRRERGYNQLELSNQNALIPPVANLSGPGDKSTSGVVVYPEDWAQLSYTRTSGNAFQISAADRAVAERIASRLLPRVDFQDNTLKEVLAYFQRVSEVNMYVDWRSLALIGVQPSDRVSLQLHDVPVRVAIERTLNQLGDELDRPRYDIEDGILAVSTNDALRKRTATIVYDIRDLLFEVPYFDDAPTLSLKDAYRTEPDDSGVGFRINAPQASATGRSASLWGEPNDEQPTPKRMTREIKVGEIIQIIQNTISPESWRELGGDVGSIQELNGNLIITNTPRQLQRVEGLLTQLRAISAMQINIEGRFLDVSSDWFEQIGVDLDLYFNLDNDFRSDQLAADPLSYLSDAFGPDGQLLDPLIYGSINQQNDGTQTPPTNATSYGQAFGIPVDTTGDGIPDSITYGTGPTGPPIRTSQGFTPAALIQNSFESILGLVELTDFGQIASATPAAVFGISFIDDIQVDLLIEATQADQRSVTLTAPRLTLFNGQRSWVAVTRQITYVSNLIPITGDGAVAFQPIPDVLNEGFVLDVEAVISADRRYVTMTVIASLSQNASFETAEIQGAVGAQSFAGGATQISSEITLPQIEVALVQTTVSVPDKGTILLGGQRRTTEIEVEEGVPVLSKLPIIKRFFTNRVTSKQENTLLVLIRPEIIIQPEQEEILFPGLLDTLGGAASYVR